MKSRLLIEMSALSIVLLTILPTQCVGQGYGGSDMGMSGMGYGGMGEDAIPRPSLSYTVDDKPYQATRVRSFRYVYQSFRPKELAYVNNDGGMGMGMGGGDMGGMGMPGGGYGSGGGYPGAVGGAESGYDTSNNDQTSERLTIKIHAYSFDNERFNDRTRIELMIEQPIEMGMAGMSGSGGMPGGSAGGMPGGLSEGGAYSGGMPGGSSAGPLPMKPLASLGTPKTKAAARLTQSEVKLVTDIICQTIWKADVVKALFASKGQGDSAAENEKFLKQLLAEQYDTQLARQEMEAESIKRRLELLVDELKRRKLAKDRVVDVQLGRLILDAQGLLNNDR